MIRIMTAGESAALAVGINAQPATVTEEQIEKLLKYSEPLLELYAPFFAGEYGGIYIYRPYGDDDFDSCVFSAEGGATWYFIISKNVLDLSESVVLAFINEALLVALKYGPEPTLDLQAIYEAEKRKRQEELQNGCTADPAD